MIKEKVSTRSSFGRNVLNSVNDTGEAERTFSLEKLSALNSQNVQDSARFKKQEMAKGIKMADYYELNKPTRAKNFKELILTTLAKRA